MSGLVLPCEDPCVKLRLLCPPYPTPQGPELEVEIVKGSQVLVTVDPEFRTRGDANTVWVDYPNIIRVVAVGGRIYIDDGLISLVVQKIGAEVPSALMGCPNMGQLLFPLLSMFRLL